MNDAQIKTKLTFDFETRQKFLSKLHSLFSVLPDGAPLEKVSEFVSNNRILPDDTPYPGPWDHKRTPLFVEIMDCCSADDPTREVAVRKSSQDGITTALHENFISYIIRVNPGPTMYVSATDKLLKAWYDMRFIPLTQYMDLQSIIGYQYKQKRNNKTGLTTDYTAFPGGFLVLDTGNKTFRMFPIKNLLLDEISAFPMVLSGEGDPVLMAEARTTNFPKNKKIIYTSTPREFGTCVISDLFAKGDQRYPFITCPNCNKEIVMEFSKDYAPYHEKKQLLERDFGLVWEMEGKQLKRDSVAYRCVECQGLIRQHQKYALLQKARWKPTAISRDKYFRSYQFSSLYSLMTTWDDIVSSYIKSDDEIKLQVFVNHKLGLPYKVQANKPKFAKLSNLKGDYHQREIPHGVLFLTFAIDIQQGSRTNPDYPPRLEMEVCGHGLKYRTWSIEYRKFIGSIDNYNEGAWLELQEFFRNEFVYYRDDGVPFKPVIGAIDIQRSPIDQENVYALSKEFPFCMPITGFAALKSDSGKDDVIDSRRHKDFDKFRVKATGEQNVIQISTNVYKSKVYSALCVERQLAEQKANFCEFPFEYDEKYFKGLVAEERRVDGTFVLPPGKHNEPLDLRVYNLAAADVQLSRWVGEERKRVISLGFDKFQAEQQINSLYVLRIIEKNLNSRK